MKIKLRHIITVILYAALFVTGGGTAVFAQQQETIPMKAKRLRASIRADASTYNNTNFAWGGKGNELYGKILQNYDIFKSYEEQAPLYQQLKYKEWIALREKAINSDTRYRFYHPKEGQTVGYPSPRAMRAAETAQDIRELVEIAPDENTFNTLYYVIRSPIVHEYPFIEAMIGLGKIYNSGNMRSPDAREMKNLKDNLKNELGYLESMMMSELVGGTDIKFDGELRDRIKEQFYKIAPEEKQSAMSGKEIAAYAQLNVAEHKAQYAAGVMLGAYYSGYMAYDGFKAYAAANGARQAVAEFAESALQEPRTPAGFKPGQFAEIKSARMPYGEVLDVKFKPSGKVWDGKLNRWVEGGEEFTGGWAGQETPPVSGGPATATTVRTVTAGPKVTTVKIAPNAALVDGNMTIRASARPQIPGLSRTQGAASNLTQTSFMPLAAAAATSLRPHDAKPAYAGEPVPELTPEQKESKAADDIERKLNAGVFVSLQEILNLKTSYAKQKLLEKYYADANKNIKAAENNGNGESAIIRPPDPGALSRAYQQFLNTGFVSEDLLKYRSFLSREQQKLLNDALSKNESAPDDDARRALIDYFKNAVLSKPIQNKIEFKRVWPITTTDGQQHYIRYGLPGEPQLLDDINAEMQPYFITDNIEVEIPKVISPDLSVLSDDLIKEIHVSYENVKNPGPKGAFMLVPGSTPHMGLKSFSKRYMNLRPYIISAVNFQKDIENIYTSENLLKGQKIRDIEWADLETFFQHLHEKGFVHGDLYLNLAFYRDSAEGKLKVVIIDFEVSKADVDEVFIKLDESVLRDIQTHLKKVGFFEGTEAKKTNAFKEAFDQTIEYYRIMFKTLFSKNGVNLD